MKHSGLFATVLTFLLVEVCCQHYQTRKESPVPNNQNINFDESQVLSYPQSIYPETKPQQQYHSIGSQNVAQQEYWSQQRPQQQQQQQQQQQNVAQQGISQYYEPGFGQQQNFPQNQAEFQRAEQPQTSAKVTVPSEGWDRALTGFSLSMLKTVVRKNPKQNVVISPFSVATILSYLQQVSTDRTQNEITNALLQSQEMSKNGYSSYIKNLEQETNAKNTLSIANSLFANQNVQFAAQAKTIARDFYGVHIDALDFSNSQFTAKTINDWVKKHTRNIIQEIVSPSDIKRNSECILLNSVYFKGVWQKMFDPARTKLLDFSPDSINNIKKPFMLANDRYDVGDSDEIGARWISVPYDGNKYAMVFVVPQKKHTLDSLLERIDSNYLHEIINTGEDYKCAIAIPKFNATFDLSLIDVLQELGIRQIFTANSQINKLIKSGQGKSISSANQKSSITIDESGTVAAAVTSIGVNTLSLPSPSELFVLRLNEPFLAILVDKKKKVPLMITKIYEP